MINRANYLDDHGMQIDPLFDVIDELLIAIKSSQYILADYLPPDSKTTPKQVITDLLGVLDNKRLVSLLRDIET